MKHNVEELNSISIIEVANKLGISIKKNKTLCFMHSEKTPSLNFNIKENYFKCFGCGESGKAINLVMKYLGYNFKDACLWLENEFGIRDNSKILKQRKPIKSTIVKPHEKNLNPVDFEVNLEILKMLELDDKAIQYLTDTRKIPIEIVKKLNIKSITNANEFYKKAKLLVGIESLVKNGFYTIDGKTGELKQLWYDDGVVFPFFNFDNKLQTFSLRNYKNQKFRYCNVAAPKCMYNENSLNSLAPNTKLIICEGLLDAVSIVSMGINAVALGSISTFKDEWYSYIKDLNNIIIFDNEENAYNKSVELESKLAKKSINAKVKRLDSFKDVNEMYIAQIKENKGF